MSANQFYPIADCISLNLKVKKHVASGKETKSITLKGKSKLHLKTEIIASFYNDSRQQAGIVTHIKGNLYLATMYNGSTDNISNWLIDGSLVGFTIDKKLNFLRRCLSIRECSDKLSHGIIKMWATEVKKHTNIDDWKKLRLP